MDNSVDQQQDSKELVSSNDTTRKEEIIENVVLNKEGEGQQRATEIISIIRDGSSVNTNIKDNTISTIADTDTAELAKLESITSMEIVQGTDNITSRKTTAIITSDTQNSPGTRIEETTITTLTTSLPNTIPTTKPSTTAPSLPYKPTPKMTTTSENRHHSATASQTTNSPGTPTSYTHYSDDPDIDPKHISNIAEDGMIALRLAEMDNLSPPDPPQHDPTPPSNRTTMNIPLPKQIIRIERDYSRGELCQFYPAFPVEIDGRVNPRQFQQTITTLNELLEKAHNPKYNLFDNFLACFSLYTSTLCIRSHYDRMVEEMCGFLDKENRSTYNNQGLNFRNPQRTAFLFLELEMY